ncbi:MAG TPA: PIG-L family deacetylase, partial [Anaerolineales bacterium]|nr:PIG-L family deacetylase [Anaerolineales bacterium]
MKVLLAVLAHPDDETFGMGGTLALYAQRGAQVQLVCATRGEAGTVSPEHLQGYQNIAQLREAELRCAAGHLGLADLHFLGYRDSGMAGSPENQHPEALAGADLQEVTGRITEHIRRIKPQVVITFDPAGGYGHPDHIATHQATVEAFQAAGDSGRFPEAGAPFQPQKLYFSTFSRRFAGLSMALLRMIGHNPRRMGRNQDIDLSEIASQQFPIHARVNYRPVVELKRQATACHASQLDWGPAGRGLAGLIWRLERLGTIDTFMRAHPPA